MAHSHLTMYGIIAFFLWGGIYAIVPRLTRQEPPQVTVGIHFRMAFIGMMFYTVPLMWVSHLVFAYNMYHMISPRKTININDTAIKNLRSKDVKLVGVINE